MSDYIKREDAIRQIVKTSAQNELDIPAIGTVIYILSEMDSADVVEVVRCKDCKHKPNGYTDDDVLRYPNFPHEENNPCPCQVYEDEWYSWIPNDDFYCSYGERKDEGL